MFSHKDFNFARKQLNDSIQSIPKKNKHKFFVDLLRLIDYAKKDDYENFNF